MGDGAYLHDATRPFPFTPPAGTEADMFIQWKGTDVCVDFYCPCGTHGHVDGYFAHAIRCHSCGAVYEMGTQVIAKRNDDYKGSIVTTD